jgi:hypothetical protein
VKTGGTLKSDFKIRLQQPIDRRLILGYGRQDWGPPAFASWTIKGDGQIKRPIRWTR